MRKTLETLIAEAERAPFEGWDFSLLAGRMVEAPLAFDYVAQVRRRLEGVAALLDLKPYTVKEYARRGILPGRKLGRNWRFLRPELEDAIQRLPKPPS